eukprot:gene10448-14033_t
MLSTTAAVGLIPLFLLLISIVILKFYTKRVVIPKHLEGHTAIIEQNLISEEIAQLLRTELKSLRKFPTNVGSPTTVENDHIGEAQPINSDGSCTHDFLMPNNNKTLCILPERIDVGKHYITTGGFDGKKEFYEDSVSRVSSFGRYTFVDNVENFPEPVKDLFNDNRFQEAAKKVCPTNASYIDPFQYNFIVQVPGQTVAFHLDCPIFWGATRFIFPQWLLVSMESSGLFQEQFINQIQVVGYLHEWTKLSNDAQIPNQNIGGQFVYYENSKLFHVVEPTPRSGILVDGSKVLHAATLYRPDTKAPLMSKDKLCSLNYVSHFDKWQVLCDDDVIQEYSNDELRLSIVYRARCFKDKSEMERFKSNSPQDKMKLDNILNKFIDDLVLKNVSSRDKLVNMSKLELAMLIMNTYIKYPLPPADISLIPYNYCLIPKLFKWSLPIFKLLC